METDDSRIDLASDDEVRRWAEAFGVTEAEIRQTVDLVGPMVKDVRQRLAQNRSY